MSRDLYTLIYFSELTFKSHVPLDVTALIYSIVEESTQKNLINDITGVLYYKAGWFTQVLEGPLNKIEDTFERIALSSQHKNIRVIEYCRADTRVFQDWSMKPLIDSDLDLQTSDLSSPKKLAETLYELRRLIDKSTPS